MRLPVPVAVALIVAALLLIVHRPWRTWNTATKRHDEQPLSFRRRRDVLVIALIVVVGALGAALFAGWRMHFGIVGY